MEKEIDIIIIKFLSNEANNEEIRLLKDWLQRDASNKKYFGQLESIYYGSQILKNKSRFNAIDAYHRFKKNQKSKSILIYKKLLPIAATLVITIGLSFFYFTLFVKDKTVSDQLTVIKTPYGSKSTVDLPDGTRIILNANSRLEYSAQFNKENREVYLEGEGYFDVAKRENSRFVVKTSDVEIKVFGTVFNVKSYPEEKTIETTLIEGSIAIHEPETRGNKKLIQLKPNQIATFYRKSREVLLNREEESSPIKKNPKDSILFQKPIQKIENIVLSENIDPTAHTSWKDNILIFDNEQFESIAVKLERQYGAKILITNPKIKDYRYTGTFNEISIEQALKALQFASHFDYTIDENEILITE